MTESIAMEPPSTLANLIAVVVAYVIGSLSFAVIVSRAMGLSDPRSYGSGNPGATNVLRSGRKSAALLTLLLDALKGYLPVMVVEQWGGRWGLGEGSTALVALAAFCGHLWPVFFRFKGGKGVATAAGVLFGLNPWLGLAAVLTFAVVVFATRYVSLASIVTAVFAPFYQLLGWDSSPIASAIVLMSALLVWRHSGNIRKLLSGTENRLGARGAAAKNGASR